MRHHYIEQGSGAHWAANTTGYGQVIAQIGDVYGDQARVALTREEAVAFALGLLQASLKTTEELSLAETLALINLRPVPRNTDMEI